MPTERHGTVLLPGVDRVGCFVNVRKDLIAGRPTQQSLDRKRAWWQGGMTSIHQLLIKDLRESFSSKINHFAHNLDYRRTLIT